MKGAGLSACTPAASAGRAAAKLCFQAGRPGKRTQSSSLSAARGLERGPRELWRPLRRALSGRRGLVGGHCGGHSAAGMGWWEATAAGTQRQAWAGGQLQQTLSAHADTETRLGAESRLDPPWAGVYNISFPSRSPRALPLRADPGWADSGEGPPQSSPAPRQRHSH